MNLSCHDTTSLFVLKSQIRRRAPISVKVDENGMPLSWRSFRTTRLERAATPLLELTDPETGACPICLAVSTSQQVLPPHNALLLSANQPLGPRSTILLRRTFFVGGLTINSSCPYGKRGVIAQADSNPRSGETSRMNQPL